MINLVFSQYENKNGPGKVAINTIKGMQLLGIPFTVNSDNSFPSVFLQENPHMRSKNLSKDLLANRKVFHTKRKPNRATLWKVMGVGNPNNYTIRVKHWYNFEDEVISKISRTFIVTNEIVQNAMHDKGGITLTRVDSGSQYYCFP
jgi:hypothetical protein